MDLVLCFLICLQSALCYWAFTCLFFSRGIFIILCCSKTKLSQGQTDAEQGYVLTSEIDGTIQMKSYLTGNPEIRLALNDDLYIGRVGIPNYGILTVTLLSAKYFLLLTA